MRGVSACLGTTCHDDALRPIQMKSAAPEPHDVDVLFSYPVGSSDSTISPVSTCPFFTTIAPAPSNRRKLVK